MEKRNFVYFLVILAFFAFTISCSSEANQQENDVDTTEVIEPVDPDQVEPVEEVLEVGDFIFARTNTTTTHYFDSAFVTEITEDSVTFLWGRREEEETYPNSNEYFYAADRISEETAKPDVKVVIAPKGTSFMFYIGDITEITEDGKYIVLYDRPGIDEDGIDTTSLNKLYLVRDI